MLETIIKALIFIAFSFGAFIYYKKTKNEKHGIFRILIGIIVFIMVLSFLVKGTVIDYSVGALKDDAAVPMNLTKLYVAFSSAINASLIILLYVGIISILYTILKKSGKYDAIVNNTAYAFRKNKSLFIVLTILVLGLISLFTGELYSMAVFVPFLISVIKKLGYSKETSIISTVGAILLGRAGTLYSGYLQKVLTQFSYDYGKDVLFRIIVTSVVLVFLIAFVLLFNKKPEKVELTKKEEKKTLPIYIIFGVVFALIIVGLIPWGTYFKFNGFEEFLNNIRKAEFLKVSIFDAFIGSKDVVTHFGAWQIVNVGALLIIVNFVLAIIYKQFKVDTLVASVKNVIPYIGIIVLSFAIYQLLIDSGIYLTVLVALGKMAYNFFTITLSAIITSIGITEYSTIDYSNVVYYGLTGITLSPSFNASPADMKLISVLFGTIHNVFLLISPISILVLCGLHYNGIRFKDWIKYVYKFFIVLILTILVICKITIDGFDMVGIIALSLLVVAIILIILMKLAFSKKIVLKVVEDEPVKESKAVVKTAEEVVEKPVVKKVSSKKPATKKTTNKKTTKK